MRRKIASLLRVVAVAATFGIEIAGGEIVISAPDVTAAPGSSGYFDVLLSYNVVGAPTLVVGGFSFDILAATPAFDFTSASTASSVAPYVFAGNSFDEINGFSLATGTGQELRASDAPNSGFAFLANGSTVSLGAVFYTLSPSASPGSIAISFQSAGTSLADAQGFSLGLTTVNGDITITPEPDQIWLILGSLSVMLFARSRRECIKNIIRMVLVQIQGRVKSWLVLS